MNFERRGRSWRRLISFIRCGAKNDSNDSLEWSLRSRRIVVVRFRVLCVGFTIAIVVLG